MMLCYESLCDWPPEVIRKMLDHCRLEKGEATIEQFAGKLKPSGYSEPAFKGAETALLYVEVGTTYGILISEAVK